MAAKKEESLLKQVAEGEKKEPEKKPTLKLKLYDSFLFDGDEVKEIDLSGLYDMTTRDMLAVDEQMLRRGYTGANTEVTRMYAVLTAARINKKPWEWCENMRARDAVRLKNVVSGFFYMAG